MPSFFSVGYLITSLHRTHALQETVKYWTYFMPPTPQTPYPLSPPGKVHPQHGSTPAFVQVPHTQGTSGVSHILDEANEALKDCFKTAVREEL